MYAFANLYFDQTLCLILAVEKMIAKVVVLSCGTALANQSSPAFSAPRNILTADNSALMVQVDLLQIFFICCCSSPVLRMFSLLVPVKQGFPYVFKKQMQILKC